MNILVLGGSGFIGTHLIELLSVSGHFITVYDRSAGKNVIHTKNVRYIKGDFSNYSILSEILVSVDAVVHLISCTVPSTSNSDPLFDINANLVNSVALLQCMRENSVNKIIYLSSGGTIYGVNNESPISESHNNFPLCSYGIVKLAFEKYMHMYHHLYGINYISLRASNPYGPNQSHLGLQGVVGTMLSKIIADECVEIWGDGLTVRDYIYVSDLARLCLNCLESNIVGCFNAGSGRGTSIIELVEKMENITNRKVKKRFMQERRFDVRDNVLDISKAKEKFDWNPSTTLDTGLYLTWKWFESRDLSKNNIKNVA